MTNFIKIVKVFIYIVILYSHEDYIQYCTIILPPKTDCIFLKRPWPWPSQGHQSMLKIDKIDTPYSVDCKISSLTVTHELLRYGTLKRSMWFGLISQGPQGYCQK